MGRSLLRRAWDTLAPLPGGRWLLSVGIGAYVPYTGSISPRIEVLETGFARVRMDDRRRLRNHLRSLHALALGNLAEFTSGLTLTYALPSDRRWIPVRIELDYLKKARGAVHAECHWDAPVSLEEGEEVLEVGVFDAAGAECVHARVTVKIGGARA